MSIKGTQTEKNLLTAFAGESQARNRYTYFASQARKEGFVQIADIFAETADHEREHAKRFFKFLEGGEVDAATEKHVPVIERADGVVTIKVGEVAHCSNWPRKKRNTSCALKLSTTSIF